LKVSFSTGDNGSHTTVDVLCAALDASDAGLELDGNVEEADGAGVRVSMNEALMEEDERVVEAMGAEKEVPNDECVSVLETAVGTLEFVND
jgi:hypothetical protein